MNIEELSKSQLLLLTLFVNFVTSVAVGVLTASLLYQAPTQVTQTVNRIVDNTVQTVATGTPLATIIPAAPAPIVKTVVQTEDDLLPAAIAGVEARTVQIYGAGGTSTPLIAMGTYLPSAHAVVTATLATGLPTEISVVFPDDVILPASISHAGATLTIYGFSDTATLPKAANPTLVNRKDLKQGEAVVSTTADGSAISGIVSKIDDSGIHTNLPAVFAGIELVDLQGELIGISTGSAGLYIPADKITTLLTATSSTLGS